MGYDIKSWKSRIANRTDLSSQLTHLTKEVELDGKKLSAVDVLIKILIEKEIKPSNTQKGFIIGPNPATCFQDVPLYSVGQNVYAEQEYNKQNNLTNTRYVAIGLMLPKKFIYQIGGRPVFYEKKDIAKTLLPESEYWRIVNFNLDDEDNFIDWTHEREWRVPSSVKFNLSEVTIILPNEKCYKSFVKKLLKTEHEYILSEIYGIVNLGSVFY